MEPQLLCGLLQENSTRPREAYALMNVLRGSLTPTIPFAIMVAKPRKTLICPRRRNFRMLT